MTSRRCGSRCTAGRRTIDPATTGGAGDLYQLARLGDMHSLRERAAHLETLNPQFAPLRTDCAS